VVLAVSEQGTRRTSYLTISIHTPGKTALQREHAYPKVPQDTEQRVRQSGILGPAVPLLAGILDERPLVVDPPTKSAERLDNGHTEIGEAVEGRGFHTPRIEVRPIKPSRSARRSVSVRTLCEMPSKVSWMS
jgi:hypothetical protein